MSGSNCTLDDDLTTDACPEPPRNGTQTKDKEEEEEIVNNGKSRPKATNFAYKPAKSPGFSKMKNTPSMTKNVFTISDSTNVHIGTVYNVFMDKKKDTNPRSQPGKAPFVTDTIKKMFSSSTPVTKEHISLISPHLNEEWRDTARYLNYSDGQISQFHEEHIAVGVKEVIYKLLLDWIQNETDAATIGRLSNALWQTNQFDAVYRWAASFPK